MPIESTDASFKLQDRTAIITGSCNSITQSIALKFTQLGANVVLMDRNIDHMQRFANQLMDQREVYERYGRAIAIQADFSSKEKTQDSISRAAESFGGIDIYIDGLVTSETVKFQEPQALDNLDSVIETNLRAPVMITHGVLKFLASRKRGRVIYLMHDIVRMGLAENALTALARTGLSAFARSLSREMATHNVTVNCIAMGLTEEFLLSQSAGEQMSIQEAQVKLSQKQSNAQMIEPEKVANMVAFLSSPLGSGLTGQTIAVSQGMSVLS